MKPAKLAMPDNLSHVKRWHAAVSARPSAKQHDPEKHILDPDRGWVPVFG